MRLLMSMLLFSLAVWSCRNNIEIETEGSMSVNEQETQSSDPLSVPSSNSPVQNTLPPDSSNSSLPPDFLAMSENLSLEHEYMRGSIIDGNGRLLVWGSVKETQLAAAIWRFKANGSIDTSFGSNGRVVWSSPENAGDYLYSVKIKEDGSILAVGYSKSSSGWRGLLGKFDENGQPDAVFSPDGYKVVDFDVSRVKYLRDAGFDSQDRILLVGAVNGLGGLDVIAIRADSDGILDTTFADNGYLQWDSADAPLLGTSEKETANSVRSDGEFIYIGLHSTTGKIMKLNEADGTVVKVRSDLQPMVMDIKFHSESIYVAGYRYSPTHDFCWGKLGADLELVTSYGTGGETCFTEPSQGNQGRGYNISINSSGEAFIGGINYENSYDGVLVKASSDGSVQSNWGTNGWSSYSNLMGFDSADVIKATVVSGDKIYVLGTTGVDIGGTIYSRIFIQLKSQ